MSKIRVLEIINDATIGGGQQHVLQLLKAVDPQKYETFISCSPKGELLATFNSNSSQYFPVNLRKKIDLKALLQLYKIIKSNKIELVHTHGGIAGLWGRLAAILTKFHSNGFYLPFFRPNLTKKVKIVHTLHGIHYLYYENKYLKRIFIFLEKLLSHFTDITVCVSEADQKNGLKHNLFSPQKSRLIRKAIDIQTVTSKSETPLELKKKLHFRPDVQLIGHVARLHYEKGQLYLLKAFQQLLTQKSDVKLLIVGDGPERQALEKFVSKQSLEAEVKFLGYRKDITDILSIIDLFVLPSFWEGLPLAILEAMALGKPVVATRVGGIPEIIDHLQDGFLVPPKNTTELSQAMLTVLNQPDLAQKLGSQAQQKIFDQYNIDRMIPKIEAVYSELI